MTTVRQALANGNPNSIPALLKEGLIGQQLATITRTRFGVVASDKMVLPENAKAASIVAIYATGTFNGWLTPLAVGSNATPTTGQVSINGAGDITFAAADAITACTVIYVPYQGDLLIFEETIDVTTNFGTLLGSRRAQVLISAISVTGTLTGALTPIKRSSSAPATGQAAIAGTATNDETKIAFAVADAVTRATVRYIALPGVGTGTGLTNGTALNADTNLT